MICKSCNRALLMMLVITLLIIDVTNHSAKASPVTVEDIKNDREGGDDQQSNGSRSHKDAKRHDAAEYFRPQPKQQQQRQPTLGAFEPTTSAAAVALQAVPASLVHDLQSSKDDQVTSSSSVTSSHHDIASSAALAQRFWLTYQTVTVTQTTATLMRTLTTFRTCFEKQPAGITDCKSTILTLGKRKKRESVITSSMTNGDMMTPIDPKTGKIIDLQALISASRVRRATATASKNESPKVSSKQTLQEIAASGSKEDRSDKSKRGRYHGFEQVTISGLDDYLCPLSNPNDDDHNHRVAEGYVEPRLITITTTSTQKVAVTSTQVVTPVEIETMRFTTVDANQCFPSQLINSLSIPAC